MTRAVALIALLCACAAGCTSRALVVPGPGDGSRDFSVVDHDLGVTDLAGADLTGADLAGLDLSVADLGGPVEDMAMVPLPKTHGGSVGTGIALLASDLDGDGDQDLVVVEAAGTVRIYNGNGKGALFPRQSFEINTNTTLSTGILADVDADGVLDLVLAEPGGTKSEVDVLRGNGDATFGDWARVLIPGGVLTVAVGDLNNDGAPDVVATTQNGLLHVMQGMPGGKPSLLIPTYAVDQGSTQVDLVDLKGDGTLYAVSVAPASSELLFWQSNGDLTFGNRSFAAEPSRSERFVLGDWDGDGLFDTATAGVKDLSSSVLEQIDLSSGVGSPVTLATGLSSFSGIEGIAAGDMTGDGIADLVSGADGSAVVTIAVANGAGLFPTMKGFVVDEGATCIALADFDNDGHLDVAAAGATKTQLYLTQP